MDAFIEHLCGIIRVGEGCTEYGKPFEYAAAFSSVDGKTAIIKGLVVPDGGFTVGHAKAAQKALRQIGLTPKYERIKGE